MAGASTPALASEVSKAGGLGFLQVGYATDPTVIRSDIRAVKDLLKGHEDHDGNTLPFGVGFITWHLQNNPGLLDAVIDEGVMYYWFSFGDPEPFVNKVRDRLPDAKVLAQIRTVAEAVECVDRCGVDVIVAQGSGAGGHGARMNASTISLVPEVVDAVGDRVPIAAAGGISDGRQLAACLMLGASGVVVGTRLCASVESGFTAEAKKRLIETSDGGVNTARTRAYENLRRLKWPAEFDFRVIRNDLVTALKAGDDGIAVEKWRGRFDFAMKSSNYDIAYLAAGESVGMVNGVWTAQRIISKMMDDAMEALRLGAAVVDKTKARL
ncbi:hypothetical protein HK101_008116 [Irineochytrium annulatum]|nr:hypothetical protein HK101_008116 [Irineochytrium annulatum]